MPSFARRPSVPVLAVLVLVVAAAILATLLIRDGSAQTELVSKRFDEGCRTTAVRFGVVLPDDDVAGRRAAEAITRDISQQIDCPAIVVTRPTQSQMLSALALHQVDFAQVDPATLVVGQRVVGLTILGAYSEVRDTAARTSPSRLWVQQDGPIADLEDAQGQTIALGPRLTAAGDLLPRGALLRAGVPVAGIEQEGTRPGAARVVRTDDDAAALRALRDDQVAMAVTTGDVGKRASRGFRALWSSEPTLADVVVIRPGVRSAVRRLLLSAVRNLNGPQLAPLAALEGIAHPLPLLPVPPDLYDPLAAEFDTLMSAGLAP